MEWNIAHWKWDYLLNGSQLREVVETQNTDNTLNIGCMNLWKKTWPILFKFFFLREEGKSLMRRVKFLINEEDCVCLINEKVTFFR